MTKLPKSRFRVEQISWEHVQALLATPGCAKDTELSQKVRRPVYQLPNGNVFLPLKDDLGVLYKSREQIMSLFEDELEPRLPPKQEV